MTRKFFVTVTEASKSPITVERMARNESRLQRNLTREFGETCSFDWSEYCAPRPTNGPVTDADWEAEGRRIALESMDLPDGAYLAMAEELGLEP